MAQLGLISAAGNIKSSYDAAIVNGIKTAANSMSGAGGLSAVLVAGWAVRWPMQKAG